MTTDLTRRGWLAAASTLTMAAELPATTDDKRSSGPFGYCLNTSTISGQKRPIAEVIAIADEAGYDGIEPWIRELDEHVQGGHSLDDLGKAIRDRGLSVAGAIGFFAWAVDDDQARKRGLEEARRNIEMVRKIGGTRIAAPPVGLTDRDDVDLRTLADRYRRLLEIGEAAGVVPEVEVWGFSKTLGRLADAAFVAVASGHRSACVLPDVFHLYKGGSGFDGVRLLGPATFGAFHFNDYPADPPREKIDDSYRVYPGDGVAPLNQLVRDLRDIGFRGMLSLELFNREYWKRDALEVARTGLEKMKAVVREALGPA